MDIRLYDSKFKSGRLDVETVAYLDFDDESLVVYQYLFDTTKDIIKEGTICNCVRMSLQEISKLVKIASLAYIQETFNNKKVK